MQLDDAQAALLKTWVIKKLEDISDADSDVLADYVLALVRGDDSPAVVRSNCIDNLTDFLQDSTGKFVDDVIRAVQTRSYDSNVQQSQPLQPLQNGPRKRTFDDRNDHDAQNGRHLPTGDRPMKQIRRGGRGGRQGPGQGNGQGQPQWTVGDGMPTMSPQDAMNMMMAMHQAMGLPPVPGMTSFQTHGQPRKRCRDYDTKGFCTRGASCKFEHGSDAVVVGQDGGTRGQRGGRGRGGQARGGQRADFSSVGPSNDQSITAIVVESVPEDKLNDSSIREFFEQFGTIAAVEIQTQRRLAIVTFTSWEEANAAWKSPKVVFDNRFVKVFWYKPDASQNGRTEASRDTEMTVEEPQIDHEEVARRQEEAQRKHEQNKKLREEAQRQKSDIDAKLKAMEDERKKFADLLAKKAAANGTTATSDSEQTKGLKAQLAKLEAEAVSMGIDPKTTPNDWQSEQSWRGRGGYRGRGRFPTRAAYRGSWSMTGRGGAVKRLDNRPRTLSIAFTTGDYDKYDEAMRQYLLFSDNLEHATLSRHPDKADAAVLVFEERYRAENFMAAVKGPSGIPNIGAVEVTWMSNPASNVTDDLAQQADAVNDTAMSNATEGAFTMTEADYDVAEDY